MATGATLNFENQGDASIVVNLGTAFQMSQPPPTNWDFDGFQTQNCYVQTNEAPVQSWFSIEINTNPALTFNLGSDLFNTSVTNNASPTTLGAIVAATSPFSSGPSFNLYAFYNPTSNATLVAMVNALIQANAAATMVAVAKKSLKLQDNLVLTELAGLDALTCTYANFSPDCGFTVILQLPSGSVSAVSADFGPLSATAQNLQLLVQGSVGATATGASVTLTTLQCYFDSYAAEGNFLEFARFYPGLSLLANLLAGIGGLAATAPNVAGLFNDCYNSKILDLANDYLANFGGTAKS